jgi:hypothetical protein
MLTHAGERIGAQGDRWFLTNYQPPNIIASGGLYGMLSIERAAAGVFDNRIEERLYVLDGVIELRPGTI